MVKEKGRDPYALLAHTGIHGLFTFAILVFYVPLGLAAFYAVLDLLAHAIMDYIKAHPRGFGRYPEGSTGSWNALGIDQWVHHMTYAFISYDLLEGRLLEKIFANLLS